MRRSLSSLISRRLRRPRLLLIGQGELAEACARALRGGAERLIWAADADVSERELSRAEVLVLADLAQSPSRLAQVGARLAEVSRQRPPRVLMIDDGVYAETAALAEARGQWPSEVKLEQVSIPAAAARRLLRRWPLHWGADPRFGQPVHLVIVGRSRFAEALLLHALRISGYGEQRTHFTLLSDRPERWQRAFTQAYPQVHEIAEVRFGSLRSLDLAELPPVTAAVVCIEADAEPSLTPVLQSDPARTPRSSAERRSQTLSLEPLEAALSQAKALAGSVLAAQQCSPPVLVEIGDAAPAGDLGDWDGQLIPISYRQLALDRAVLLEGRGDELARVIHNHYRDTTEAQGRDPSLEPAGQPWASLASSYRDANRHQADHLWAKLAITDCQAVPESQVESFAFAPIEVERLAVIEHGRWAADRWLDGWSYAPVRDNARKHHPQLIPYQQLSGPMKDLDRFAVRLVPTLLARSGLGVLRMLLVGLAPRRGQRMAAAAQRERRAARPIDLMRRLLSRLARRYPDRALIIASSLEDPIQRRFAQMACDERGAGFFLLLPRPLPDLLDGLDQQARLQVLGLVARAERRISLSGAGELERWLDQRAEILVELSAAHRFSEQAPGPRKRVRIEPETGLDWSFEY